MGLGGEHTGVNYVVTNYLLAAGRADDPMSTSYSPVMHDSTAKQHFRTALGKVTSATPTHHTDRAIPQLYSDVAWVPYAELYPQFGFMSSLKGLPALLEHMTTIAPATWARMESKAVEHRESHFTLEGVMEQIQLFMQPDSGAKSGRTSDLRCQAMPTTIRHVEYQCSKLECREPNATVEQAGRPRKRAPRPPPVEPVCRRQKAS